MSIELRYFRLSPDAYQARVAPSSNAVELYLAAFDGVATYDVGKSYKDFGIWLGTDENPAFRKLFFGCHETPLLTEMGNIRMLLPEEVQSASVELDNISLDTIEQRVKQVLGPMPVNDVDLLDCYQAICENSLEVVDEFRGFFRSAAENGELVLLYWW